MVFRYSLVSDLHLDHPQPKTPPLEQNILVAGDSGNGLVGITYLNKLKRKGHFVFAVDGNHEHYANRSRDRTIAETERAFYEHLEQPQQVRIADDLVLLGTNGWYPVEDEALWRSWMNDGRYAGSAAEVNLLAQTHAQWLDAQLAALTHGRAIVVTHTAPTPATLDPRFAGYASNDWFWNPLLEPVLQRHADKIAIWHHGHTHAAADVVAHGVRIVTNPRGYPGENPGWAPLVLEID